MRKEGELQEQFPR